MTWEQAEERSTPVLRCPLCQGTGFDTQQGRLDSRWGITSHKVVMKICQRCGLVLQFSAGRGIFDFALARPTVASPSATIGRPKPSPRQAGAPRITEMFSATRTVVVSVIVALLSSVPFTSAQVSPSPGMPGVPVSPSPSAAQIHWVTPVVDLAADAFSVEANGLEFTTEGAPLGVGSDPGGPDYWTLEAEWLEQGSEQRLYMYFGSDGTDWWVDEIRTRDGYDPAEWIYAYGPFLRTPLGEAYEGDVRIDLLGEGRPGDRSNKVAGVLAIDGMHLEVHPLMLADIAAIPIDGGKAATKDPFRKGGPLHCSGILLLPPAEAHERLLEKGYRVSYRLDPGAGVDIDPTVPPAGVIEDAAVDSYGNLVLFVVGPESSYQPTAKLPRDCRQDSDEG